MSHVCEMTASWRVDAEAPRPQQMLPADVILQMSVVLPEAFKCRWTYCTPCMTTSLILRLLVGLGVQAAEVVR